MKRAVILHGWEGNPGECWFPWLKGELEKSGFKVEVPQMPNPKEPQMSEWVPRLAEVVGNPDGETCLVGHSLGCITILRYLEGLPEGKRIGRVVMVAGFTDPLGYRELENYFQKPIDWEKIKKHCSDFVAINSDNDPYVPLKHADAFRERLGARIIIEHGKGHMSDSANIKELPSVLKAVKG
jgi:predicted alpha/beta hydrolase family esterase